MKIVVLDGYAANPGDLSWDELKSLGECTVYDRTAPAEVLERAAGADILLTNKVVLDATTIAALPQLKYIGVLATGYNIIDTAAAKERGITVTNIPAYSTPVRCANGFCPHPQHHPTGAALHRRDTQRPLDQQPRFLLLGHSAHRTEWQEKSVSSVLGKPATTPPASPSASAWKYMHTHPNRLSSFLPKSKKRSSTNFLSTATSSACTAPSPTPLVNWSMPPA